MKKIAALFILGLFVLKLVALDDFAANVAYKRAKSFVLKEEAIGKAFKEYLLEKGTIPTINDLTTNDDYLPQGFSIINDFGKSLSIESSANIKNEINVDTKSITKFYDYYYSNSNRVYTQAPEDLTSNLVKIKLSNIESFIFNNQSEISTTQTADKYFLEKATIALIDSSGNKTFSYNGKDIVIHDTAVEFDPPDATVLKLINEGFLSVGTIVYKLNSDDSVSQIIYLGKDDSGKHIFKEFGSGGGGGETLPSGILQLSTNSGGYLLNGDIYAWGNNNNKIITLEESKYLDDCTQTEPPECTTKTSNGTISTPVRLKTKVDSENYYSSPLRVKYIDFFVNSENGTCGVSEDFKLYCTNVDGVANSFLLNHVTFFDGINIKANKVVAFGNYWYVLVNGEKDEYGSYVGAKLYKYDQGATSDPILIDDDSDNSNSLNSYKDIKVSNDKLFLLRDDGKVYSFDSAELQSNSTPTLMSETPSFVKLRSSFKGVVAIDSSNKEYYIYQDSNIVTNVDKISTETSIYSDAIYNSATTTVKNIYIDENNQLISENSDYNVSSLTIDLTSTKWFKAKFISEETICAIDFSYQLYCWGKVGFNNTLVVPLLNSNNFTKFIEDGADVNSYKLDNPTYINGFNYNFTFK